MSAEGGVATALRLRPVVEAGASEFSVIVHSEGLRPLYDLLLKVGKAALTDIDAIHRALAVTDSVGGEAALEAGWQALNRLADNAARLRGTSRQAVGIELERAAQGLLARQEGFAVAFTEDIEHAIAQRRHELSDEASQALTSILGRDPAVNQQARVLAQLSDDVRGAPAAVGALWRRYTATAGGTLGLRTAAQEAAERAEAIDALLRSTGPAAESALWGYVVRVRGLLGEAYGLNCPPWLELLGKEVERARALLAKLGPGHDVLYLTQTEHALALNGREAADALVAIVDSVNRRLYEVARVQVKVARFSEGAMQTANDAARSVGHEAGTTSLGFARYTFEPGAAAAPVARMVSSHPDIATNVYLINATGSKTPAKDLTKLTTLGARITEVRLDMSVADLTQLSVSLLESALRMLKRVR